MKGYVQGRQRENTIKQLFWTYGYTCFRPAASAGGDPKSDVKPVDLIALKQDKPTLLVQASKRPRDVTNAELEELKRLAAKAGATACTVTLQDGRYQSTLIANSPQTLLLADYLKS